MVTRRRFRAFINALALYTIAALLIGYFAVNAFTGSHGLRARQDLDHEVTQLTGELVALRTERAILERRVSLLRPESIDADMLDERARALLEYSDPRELILLRGQP